MLGDCEERRQFGHGAASHCKALRGESGGNGGFVGKRLPTRNLWGADGKNRGNVWGADGNLWELDGNLWELDGTWDGELNKLTWWLMTFDFRWSIFIENRTIMDHFLDAQADHSSSSQQVGGGKRQRRGTLQDRGVRCDSLAISTWFLEWGFSKWHVCVYIIYIYIHIHIYTYIKFHPTYCEL